MTDKDPGLRPTFPKPDPTDPVLPEAAVTPRRLPHDELHDAVTQPELPATLETLSALQTHAIGVIEKLSADFQNLDKEWAAKLLELREERKHLMDLSTRLSETAMKLLTARAILQVVPTASRLMTLMLGATMGAFAGAFTATWMWLSLHPLVVR